MSIRERIKNIGKPVSDDYCFVMTVKGHNIETEISKITDNKVEHGDPKKKSLAGDSCYYIEGYKKLENTKLPRNLRLYLKDNDTPREFKIEGSDIEFSQNTQNMLMDEGFLKAMFSSLKIDKFTLLLYMSTGYFVLTVVMKFVEKLVVG